MGVDGKLAIPGSFDGRLPKHRANAPLERGSRTCGGQGSATKSCLWTAATRGYFRGYRGFSSRLQALTNDLILMPRRDLLDFFGLPSDRATDLRVQVYNPSEIETVAAKIKHCSPTPGP